MKYMKDERESNGNFWTVFTDVLSVLLLAITVILAVSLINSSLESQKKAKLISELEEIIQEKDEDINKLTGTIAEKIEEIDKYIEIIEEGEDDRKYGGIREEIADEIKNVCYANNINVDIDPKTGVIVYDGSFLFESGKSTITNDFKSELEKFIPVYIGVLTDPRFMPYIMEIVIEGHTDNVPFDKEGSEEKSYLDNLQLSQDRALSIVNFIIESNMLDEEGEVYFRGISTANGRSFSNLIYLDNGEVDKDSSRRVEISFRMKEGN